MNSKSRKEKQTEAIRAINPDARFIIRENDLTTIEWEDTTPIPVADIEAKMAEVQTEYDAKQYQRDREIAYPTWQEQNDMQYWDKVNGTTTWEDAIAKVKSDNPKS